RVAPFVIGDTTFGGPDGGYTDVTSISDPGTGDGSDGTTVRFNALRELQRPGLQIVNGIVYVAWASHGDNRPYHGWVVGFNPTTLQPVPGQVFTPRPTRAASGAGQSGAARAVHAQGNLSSAIGTGSTVNGRPPFSGGPAALGGGGGSLGYEGIGNSVAVTLRAFTSSQIGL